jgi:peroxiredoxin
MAERYSLGSCLLDLPDSVERGVKSIQLNNCNFLSKFRNESFCAISRLCATHEVLFYAASVE